MKKLATRKQYIEALNFVLSARDDFKKLEYFRHNADGSEYLFLTDMVGQVAILDVTGYSDASIYHALAIIECGGRPRCYVKDQKKRLELGKMFK